MGHTQDYYRRLLGDTAAEGNEFRIGPSVLLISAAPAQDSFQVAVRDFEPQAALDKLKQRGIAAQLTMDGAAVWFLDPDGLRVQIGGS